MKKVLLLLLMLVAGIAAQATVQTEILIQGMTRTSGSTSFCVWAVESNWGTDQQSMLPGSSYTFKDYAIHGNNSPATITLDGTLNFQEGTSAADVTTQGAFTVTIESSTLWFYGASVKTKSGTAVSECSSSTGNNRHTLTVTIPWGKTFGYITVNYVGNEPLSSDNTVISGVDDEYIYQGSAIEPEPVVTYNGSVLAKDTDYTVSYSGSNGVGTATVTVTGTGAYAGDIRKNYTIRKVALTDFNSLGNKTYEIATTTDLDHLALYISGDDHGNGLTFKQTADIAFTYTTDWNGSGENNFTAIGGFGNSFRGTYDGQNHIISGIRIYKNGASNYDGSQGLFGYISSGAVVKNVILADANIVGYNNTGGIVGYNGGTIEDCVVESNVWVQTIKETNGLGGITGISEGTISHCIFKGWVSHSIVSSTAIGGIVGTFSGTVSNCLVLGANVSGFKYSGAIAGSKTSTGTLTANYYYNCRVTNDENSYVASVNVGVGIGDGSEDQDGARSVHAITQPDGVTATGESIDIDGATYYAAATTVTLSYAGEVPEGYQPIYSVNGTAIEGDSFEMPASNATVSIMGFGLSIDSVNFPDANFRNWLLAQDYGSDGVLTDEEIAAIITIDVASKSIADLTGIEHFTALTQLKCADNQLTELDVSQNTALTRLDCSNNSLTELEVSQNTALEALYCYNNQLTELDVSQNTALMRLGCSNNQLKGLDVSYNTALDELDCSLNQLTGLDVSQNTALKTLYCYSNQLTELDVSHNTALNELYCFSNQLTGLDVSYNTTLIVLNCSGNQLTELNVSQNTALDELYCSSNQINGGNMEALVASLPTVEESQVGKFYVIDLYSETEQNVITTTQVATARAKNWSVLGWTGNRWEEYDGSADGLPIDSVNFPDANFRNYLLSRPYGSDGVLTDGEIAAIITIDVASKSIADLTGIEHFTALQALYCTMNQLTELDVSHNTALIFLACNSNQLTGLDVSHNTALDVLYCFNNPLTELDVSHNTALRQLNCSNNQLTELDVSQNTALKTLDCSNNSLTELEVSQNTALEALYCYNNQLTELEVSQNTALMRLGCSNNPLTGLDVSYNTALRQLNCSNNQLTALDVCQNTALETLDCSNNQLTALDVSQNTALGVLDCSGNQINGGNMEALVASLPTVDVDYLGENGEFIVIDLDSETEQNVITTTQVGTARGKNWTVYGLIDDDYQEYAGSEPTYTISLPESFEHGMVTSDKAAASIGEIVTLTVTPDDGYELENLTVATVDGEPSGAPLRLRGGSVELTPGENGTYTFEMPAAPVAVTATFREAIATGVEDINMVTAKSGQRYNLMGQPVGKGYKGIVIENGKKVIVR